MNTEESMLSQRSQSQKIAYCMIYLYSILKKTKQQKAKTQNYENGLRTDQ